MKPKDTEKLLELLKKTGSIDAYLQENKDFLLDCNIKEYLRALIREKGSQLYSLHPMPSFPNAIAFSSCLSPTHAIHPGMFC